MSKNDFTVRPMPVGAEIVGFPAGAEHDPAVRERLYKAWLDHGILLFRGVDSIPRHLDITRCFGELEIHPVPEVRYKEDPNLIEIGAPFGAKKKPTVYVFDGDKPRISRIAWHRDTAYTPDICKGAMLRMLEVPEHEGETMLADTAMAWDDLPEDVKKKLEGLEYKSTICIEHMNTRGRPGTFWKSVRVATDDEDMGSQERRDKSAVIDSRYPSVIHPAMLTHPESGRKCIFLSPTYVDYFIGMDPAESKELHLYLTAHMLQDKYVYKHKWQVNDAIVWDNRRFMHAGMGNDPKEPRYGLRTTLAGPMTTGRYFDPNSKKPSLMLTD